MIISDLNHLEVISESNLAGGYWKWEIRPVSLEEILPPRFRALLPPWITLPEETLGLFVSCTSEGDSVTSANSATIVGVSTQGNGIATFAFSSSGDS